MKKVIAIILVTVFAVLALASCNNNTKKPDASTPSGFKPGTPAQSTPENPESTPDYTPDNTTFDTRDEIVYTTDDLKLRTSNNFNGDANVALIVNKGTELKRVGVGIEDPAVSKVVYNGVDYYCGSRYLSTEAPSTAPESSDEIDNTPVAFLDTDQTVAVDATQATVYTEAYKGWSTENKKNVAKFVLEKDTEVKVTGVCYENENDLEVGWARIEYNNDTYYVRISVLAEIAVVTAPAESTPVETPAATPAA